MDVQTGRMRQQTAPTAVVGARLAGAAGALLHGYLAGAVFFVLKIIYDVNWYHIIESGGGSVATLIVSRFGEASGPFEVQLLLAAGFFLFLMTLIVNMIANLIVSRTGRLKK